VVVAEPLPSPVKVMRRPGFFQRIWEFLWPKSPHAS
jgi:hypothetical protein